MRRGVRLLGPEGLAALSTARLLALRDRLLRCENEPGSSDLAMHERRDSHVYFESDPRWIALHGAVVRRLAGREHVAAPVRSARR